MVALLFTIWLGYDARAMTTEAKSAPATDMVVLAVRPPQLSSQESDQLQRLAAALRESLRAKKWKVWSAEATKAWLFGTKLSPEIPLEHLRKRIHHADTVLAPSAPNKAFLQLHAALHDLRKLHAPSPAHLELEHQTRIRAAELCAAIDECASSSTAWSREQIVNLQHALFARPQLELSTSEFAPSIRQNLEIARSNRPPQHEVRLRLPTASQSLQLFREGAPLALRSDGASDAVPAGLTRLAILDDSGGWHQGRWNLPSGDVDFDINPWLAHRLWLGGPGLMQWARVSEDDAPTGPFQNLFPSGQLLLLGIENGNTERRILVTLVMPPLGDGDWSKLALPDDRNSADGQLHFLALRWPEDANMEHMATLLVQEIDTRLASNHSLRLGTQGQRQPMQGTSESGDESSSAWIGALLGIALAGTSLASALGATWYFMRP